MRGARDDATAWFKRQLSPSALESNPAEQRPGRIVWLLKASGTAGACSLFPYEWKGAKKSELVEAAEELGVAPPENLMMWVISRAVSSPGTKADWFYRAAREATRNIHEAAQNLCSCCGWRSVIHGVVCCLETNWGLITLGWVIQVRVSDDLRLQTPDDSGLIKDKV